MGGCRDLGWVGAKIPASSTNFLSIESTEGGYNEITILREPTLNFDPTKDESLENIKYNIFSDQPLIREKVSGQFQKFYGLQPNLKHSREELLKFLTSLKTPQLGQKVLLCRNWNVFME